MKYITKELKNIKNSDIIFTTEVKYMVVDKKENFKRIAEARTEKILKSINLLGNLANTSYYEYTPDQINLIFSAIEEELADQKKKNKL